MGIWTPGPGSTSGNDVFVGGADFDTASGGDGNDQLSGAGGQDDLRGDGGNDTLDGGDGDDGLDGGDGDDTLDGGEGNDYLLGNAGADTLNGGAGSDNLNGGLGVMTLFQAFRVNPAGGPQILVWFWGIGLTTDDGVVDILNGGDGDDVINVGQGDIVDGGSGTDTVGFDLTHLANGVTLDFTQASGAATLASLLGASFTSVEVYTGRATNHDDTVTLGAAAFGSLRGGAGDDTIVATSGTNSIYGEEGADSITGGSGNDSLYGNNVITPDYLLDSRMDDGEIDTISALGGNDTVGVGLGDIADGGEGTDVLWVTLVARQSGVTLDLTSIAAAEAALQAAAGGQFSNFERFNLFGTNFDDVIVGGQEVANIRAEGGNDTLTTLRTNGALLAGGDGNDTLNGGAGNDSLYTGAGDNTVFGNGGSDQIYIASDGRSGETLSSGTNIVDGGAGIDYVSVGMTGFDEIADNGFFRVIMTNVEVAEGNSGRDWFTFQDATGFRYALGNGGDDILEGGAGVEELYGDEGNDTLRGGGGDDYLSGGADNDTLEGGEGNDELYGDAGDDLLHGGAGADILNGGDGIDTADYAGSGAVTVQLSTGTGTGGDAQGDTLFGIENVNGGAAGDTLTGSDGIANRLDGRDGNDTLSGLSGDDTLIGGAGDDVLDGGLDNDTLRGGAGADTMLGGAGVDTVDYTGSTGSVTVKLWNNTATGGDAQGDVISGFENVTGGSNGDTLVGSLAVGNVLDGGAGNDYIAGLSGNDTLIGGAGNDTLDGGDDNDTLIGGIGANSLLGGAGIDTASYRDATAGVTVSLANAAAQNTVGAGVDTLSGIENLTGSAFNDTLAGDAGANTLDGGDGDDVLRGAAGADALLGGAGNDTLEGGDDNDTLVGGLGANSLSGGAGIDTASYRDAAGGVTVSLANAGAQNTIGAGVDTLSGVENLIGSTFNDTLGGDAGANTLDGGDGDDVLRGAAGADALIGGAGIDTADYTGSGSVTVRLWNGTGLGGDAQGDTLSGIENVTGGAVGDTIVGSDNVANVLDGAGGNDYIAGLSGDDTLFGREGNDILDGGAGNDVIHVGSGVDQAIGGLGDDLFVLSTVSFGFPDSTFDGGAGFDTFDYSVAASSLVFGTVSGSPGSFSVGDNIATGIERIVSGSGDDSFFLDGFGSPLTIHGGAGADYFSNPSSGSTIFGESGDDRFWISGEFLATVPMTTINGGTGIDLLQTNIAFTVDLLAGIAQSGNASFLLSSIERVEVAAHLGHQSIVRGSNLGESLSVNPLFNDGSVGVIFEGRGGADGLTGGLGNDLLDGGAANDVLIGGAGADTLIGGEGIDTAVYANSSSILVRLWNGTGLGGEAQGDTLSGIENVIGGAFGDTIIGSEAIANRLNGGGGNDYLAGLSGDDVLIGGAGADILDGGAGIDWADYLSSTSISVNLSLGTGIGGEAQGDTLSGIENVLGGAEGDTIVGSDNVANLLQGNGGDDFLSGLSGDDTLIGGFGNDVLNGGAGVDVLRGEDGDDTLELAVTDLVAGGKVFDGGAGTDTLKLTGGQAGLVTNVSLFSAQVTSIERLTFATSGAVSANFFMQQLAGVASATIVGSDNADTVQFLALGPGTYSLAGTAFTFENWHDGDGLEPADFESFVRPADSLVLAGVFLSGGVVGDFNLTGSSGRDSLFGNAYNDVLNGGDGDDILVGGFGVDQLFGGAGDDALVISGGIPPGGVINTDEDYSLETYDGGEGRDFLTAVGNVTFNGALTSIEGFAFGIAADASLTIGWNTVSQMGPDVHIVGSDFATRLNIIASGASMIDLSQWRFANNYWNEAQDLVNVVGSAAGDQITGTVKADRLDGGDGDDVLRGGVGADTLLGGAGVDTLDYTGSAGSVTVKLWNNTATGGDAQGDVISGFENVTGGSNGDTLVGSLAVGNVMDGGAGNDYLSGLSGNDTLIGGAGNDILDGGDDNDTLVGGIGANSLLGGAGIDTASYRDASGGVTVSLANAGAQNTIGAGVDTLSGVENLTGSAFNDTLAGDAGANTLDGGDGDDVLRGAAGADALLGGAGIDTADYTGSGSVTVRLWNGTGVGGDAQGDTLSGIENVIGGAASDTIIGSENAANVLDGAGGNDYLAGLSGDDVLRGGAGGDILEGGAGVDTLDYTGSAGSVTVKLWNNTASGGDAQGDVISGFENVTGGSNGDTLVGSLAVGNVMDGGAGNDYLSGLSGDDTLIGGAGNDILEGGDDNDLFLQGALDGRDIVNGGAGTDTWRLTGSAASETFRIMTRSEALALGITGLAANTEIVVTRDGTTNAHVIAELDDIEEIEINSLVTTADNGNGAVDGGAAGGDTVIVIGDFTTTSLAYSTIHIAGSDGNDTVDISGLTSDHRVVFNSNGGEDAVIGDIRPQDVFEGIGSSGIGRGIAPGAVLEELSPAHHGFGASDGLAGLLGGLARREMLGQDNVTSTGERVRLYDRISPELDGLSADDEIDLLLLVAQPAAADSDIGRTMVESAGDFAPLDAALAVSHGARAEAGFGLEDTALNVDRWLVVSDVASITG